MRCFYFFIFVILPGFSGFAQDSASATRPVSIRINCQATLADNSMPLFIVNGKQFPPDSLSKIDPATIQTIDVLKDAKATALYGSRGVNGVVYVTLKQEDKYVFRLLDEEDSTGIDLATVTFIDKNNDSIRLMTDQHGGIKAGLLMDDGEYRVSVKAFGYENLQVPFKVSKGKQAQQFFLKREVKELGEVIVRGLGYVCILRRIQTTRTVTQYCGFDTVRDSVIQSRAVPVITGSKVFPNPVLRGGMLKIELIADDTSPKQVRVLTLTGALLSNLTYIPVKGLNRINVPVASHWPAGAYTVQVSDQKGKLSSQHKLIVQ